MKNYVQPGETLSIPAPANVTSGGGVRSGLLFGVAQHDALSGEDVEILTCGVVELPKTSAQAWAVGDAIYWSSEASSTAGTGRLFIGVAVAVAANPSSVGTVRLNGSMPVAATS